MAVPPTRSPYPCVTDATSVRGLPALRRHRPDGWVELLREGARAAASLPTRSLGTWLRASANGDLLPQSAADESFRARRASARRWLDYCDVPIDLIDEARLWMMA